MGQYDWLSPVFIPSSGKGQGAPVGTSHLPMRDPSQKVHMSPSHPIDQNLATQLQRKLRNTVFAWGSYEFIFLFGALILYKGRLHIGDSHQSLSPILRSWTWFLAQGSLCGRSLAVTGEPTEHWSWGVSTCSVHVSCGYQQTRIIALTYTNKADVRNKAHSTSCPSIPHSPEATPCWKDVQSWAWKCPRDAKILRWSSYLCRWLAESQ